MKRRIFMSSGCTITLLGCASSPMSASCVMHDLGPFSMCVPDDWKQTKGGIDSVAGTFRAKDLLVTYDFGLYSDPLLIPADATDASEKPVSIDGLEGRSVAFTRQPSRFVGVHLPSIRETAMGKLKLTVLAQSTDAANLLGVDMVFRTIRLKR